MSINAPCKDCPNKKVTENYNCHSHCDAYQLFRDKLEEYRLEQSVQKEADAFFIERNYRIAKYIGGKKHVKN